MSDLPFAFNCDHCRGPVPLVTVAAGVPILCPTCGQPNVIDRERLIRLRDGEGRRSREALAGVTPVARQPDKAGRGGTTSGPLPAALASPMFSSSAGSGGSRTPTGSGVNPFIPGTGGALKSDEVQLPWQAGGGTPPPTPGAPGEDSWGRGGGPSGPGAGAPGDPSSKMRGRRNASELSDSSHGSGPGALPTASSPASVGASGGSVFSAIGGPATRAPVRGTSANAEQEITGTGVPFTHDDPERVHETQIRALEMAAAENQLIEEGGQKFAIATTGGYVAALGISLLMSLLGGSAGSTEPSFPANTLFALWAGGMLATAATTSGKLRGWLLLSLGSLPLILFVLLIVVGIQALAAMTGGLTGLLAAAFNDANGAIVMLMLLAWFAGIALTYGASAAAVVFPETEKFRTLALAGGGIVLGLQLYVGTQFQGIGPAGFVLIVIIAMVSSGAFAAIRSYLAESESAARQVLFSLWFSYVGAFAVIGFIVGEMSTGSAFTFAIQAAIFGALFFGWTFIAGVGIRDLLIEAERAQRAENRLAAFAGGGGGGRAMSVPQRPSDIGGGPAFAPGGSGVPQAPPQPAAAPPRPRPAAASTGNSSGGGGFFGGGSAPAAGSGGGGGGLFGGAGGSSPAPSGAHSHAPDYEQTVPAPPSRTPARPASGDDDAPAFALPPDLHDPSRNLEADPFEHIRRPTTQVPRKDVKKPDDSDGPPPPQGNIFGQ